MICLLYHYFSTKLDVVRLFFSGLYGKTNLDRAKSDMLIDGINDMMGHIRRFFPEKDEAVKV